MDVFPALAADETGVVTLPQLWRRRCAQWGDRPALRHKERGIWKGLAWGQYFSEARAIGMAMADAGLEPGDVVSLLSDNRPEWLVADIAAQSMGFVSHGIYPCSTAAQVGHALREAGSRVVIVENADQLVKVLAAREACPGLRQIVVIETRGLRRFTDPQVSSYEDLRARGTAAADREPGQFDARIDAGTGGQIAFLGSTAGSTAAARLVAVRHDEFVPELRTPRHWLRLLSGDRVLSIVSLAHHGERLLTAKAMLMHESLVHFPENQTTVLNDLLEVAPHFVFATPRFFEKLQGVTELFMQGAIPVARRAYAASLAASRPRWWHRMTRKRVRSGLGLQNVRLALTGGASTPAQVADWFDAIGVPMFDGYGLAERHLLRGASGPVARRCTLARRARRAAEAGVRRRDRGQRDALAPWLLGTRSAAACATDADGWLRTGDLGRIDEHGRVRLLGRVGARVVGSQGEAISPEIAEDAFRLSAYIADAVVVRAQDGRWAGLLALDEERIRHYAQQHKLHFTDYASLLGLSEINSLVAAQVEIANERLSDSHRVRSIQIIPHALRPGDEELTPALRLKREVVAHRYADLLEMH